MGIAKELRQWRTFVDAQITTLNLIESLTEDVLVVNKAFSVTLSANPDWFQGSKDMLFNSFKDGAINGDLESITFQKNTAAIVYCYKRYEIKLTGIISDNELTHQVFKTRTVHGEHAEVDSGPTEDSK
jgi:uncharacterized protein YrrD